MRKRGVALLLAAALAVTGLSGCGAASGETSSGREKVRLMVWSPQNDQSRDNGQWLQTMCEAFAEEHPEWDITFVYGVADEASAAGQVSQDPEASADVFMYANDTLTTLTDANALAKFGGTYREQIEGMNSQEVIDSLTMDDNLYGVPFTTNTWFMYYDKSVFSEEDIKSLDTMLEKGVVSFPFTNSWYLPAFYLANGCTLFGDGTDEAAGVDFGGHQRHVFRFLGRQCGEGSAGRQHGCGLPSHVHLKWGRKADAGVCRFQGDRREPQFQKHGRGGTARGVPRVSRSAEGTL